ncbi:hypothetical protein AMTRI_Chr03g147650 [Amborella trichopoda]|uniref:CRM domain-containing protein n=1 Tax=Amborella trichopoda TaxID=13333 RepID=W1P0F5_AMBTC|nr:CRM-domain containing factor CFM3, chloroplastic/mitochondrial [Amborella trichopoda]ERN01418.1 hypothetical protein AMTR_s00002p00265220 [Amborella trichopoda]|eukprot:XP_006838849.1 CRM-domain containing factor CFM3, chloroplastic/mitochondrial [Amborella trichopoda]
MAFTPSRPLYPTALLDSLHSTWSRFNGSRLQITRLQRTHVSSYLNTITNSKDLESPEKISPNPHCNGVIAEKTTQVQGHWIHKWTGSQCRNLPKRPKAVLDYRDNGVSSDEQEDINSKDDELGFEEEAEKSTMDQIVDKLKRFGFMDERKTGLDMERRPERGSVEDVFYAEPGVLPNSRGGLSLDSPNGVLERENGEVRFPWQREVSVRKTRSRTSLAELTLPASEIRRLTNLALRMKGRTKIKGAGVTQAIVDSIHKKWKSEEIVRIKCEGAPTLNMKRSHEILERKTGGLVIWRSGSSIVLYRGINYDVSDEKPAKKQTQVNRNFNRNGSAIDEVNGSFSESVSSRDLQRFPEEKGVNIENKTETEPPNKVNYEKEVDQLLEGLGPRYNDWAGCDPLPVDADLLPGVVPGYKPPFRLLPYGMRFSLGRTEMTTLRRLARVLPPHFALGRSRQHQGLAVAMVKVWEKSSIVKIALKRGVQNTCGERMAEQIKSLTGGTLLSRNKDFMVFYRGKDFLSPEVTEALLERERLAKALQDEEENARLYATASIISDVSTTTAKEEPRFSGTLSETLEASARWGKNLDSEEKEKMIKAAEATRHAGLVRKLERKLDLAQQKAMRAEKALAKVEEFLKPTDQSRDQESITDEERFMFRKLGLRMKAYLLLGKRGVFDGTVENMHLHWKYRELIKIILKAKNFGHVKNIALSLEAESGGILVSVDKISKGYAIIVYRGKGYKRPRLLRPQNLLTKRKALARSIELQRREALNNHISNLQKRVQTLKSELAQMESIKEKGDEDLYAKLDSVYCSEDDETEDEDDEAYLETYYSCNEDERNLSELEIESDDFSLEEGEYVDNGSIHSFLRPDDLPESMQGERERTRHYFS